MADNDHFSPNPEASRGPETPNQEAPGPEARSTAHPVPGAQSPPPVRRSGPDPITLTAGLLTLAVAVYVLVGSSWSLQWVLAIGAIGIGAVMLVVSLRPRRDR